MAVPVVGVDQDEFDAKMKCSLGELRTQRADKEKEKDNINKKIANIEKTTAQRVAFAIRMLKKSADEQIAKQLQLLGNVKRRSDVIDMAIAQETEALPSDMRKLI